MKHQDLSLHRSTSTTPIARSSSRKIIPSKHFRSSSSTLPLDHHHHHQNDDVSNNFLIPKQHSPVSIHHISKTQTKLTSLLRSFLSFLSFPTIIPTCKWLAIPPASPSLFPGQKSHRDALREPPWPCQLRRPAGSQVGARFASRACHVNIFTRQGDVFRTRPHCSRVRKASWFRPYGAPSNVKSWLRHCQEPSWTMYCNGRKCGYAASRTCGESDWHVLTTVRSVSVGAGVIPVVDDGKKGSASEGELLYMRARFERVVGSRDSEAFYMLNPEGNGGPELSIFLLRI
ncbi:protein MIZU-KUSSEI 1 [Prunus yedoensis var. nudiflora]|uniref:Protein MIZU-KUSSEI 1 n=1 Tax=Prunus yedoensis var. nudiflora TaxID=2094558 RepID=A0A314XQZ9_PRUYE|nr:protein MIZU-KUSSEI 1 [Prunus yedoensis var. nudiflora]